jgi:hypothetical protein
MKKIDFIQVSQLISNVAVVVGILFLAVQVREAGNTTQLQLQAARAEGYNALNLALASDADLSRILVIGLDDPDRLTSIEAARFSNLMRAMINQHRQMHEQYALGLISEETWVYFAQQAAQIYSTAGGRRFLETNDYEGSSFMGAIKPFMGQELRSSFSLGRSAQDL